MTQPTPHLPYPLLPYPLRHVAELHALTAVHATGLRHALLYA